jgi:hypothetical protein
MDVVAEPAPVVGATATGAVATIGEIQAPDAVSIHVAGKPRETHDVKLVVEVAEPATGTQMIVAEPLR